MTEAVSGGTETAVAAGAAAATEQPAAAATEVKAESGITDPKATALSGVEKPADGAATKPKDGAADEGATDAPVEIDLKFPEGFEVDEELVGGLKGLAKELGIPADKAQALADLGVKAIKAQADAQSKLWETTVEKWRTEAKADPEIGGNAYDSKVALANKALKAFGNDKLIQLMIDNGSGDHAEMIRCFAKIGEAMSEASVIDGSPAAAKKTPVDTFYDHPTSKA